MSDGIPLCGRSGKPLSDKALVLALAQAVSESVPRDLRICARCIESFQRWYWKRAKSTASSAANVQCANVTAPGIVSISRRSRHPRAQERKEGSSAEFVGRGNANRLAFPYPQILRRKQKEK